MRTIYLDYNAAAPVIPEVASRVGEWVARLAANPSSIHAAGRAARQAIDTAREDLAELLEAEQPDCLYFTGSATEANALAIAGYAQAIAGKKRVLCSAIEHPSVIRTMEAFAAQHNLKCELLPVTPQGCLSVEMARAMIAEDVLVCAVMLANNETGTIQPIDEISELCRAKDVPLHVDAVQAAGKLPLSIRRLAADTLTISGHKVGGLRGAAVLYVRPGLQLNPLYFGGKQERALRPGTENSVAIASLPIAFRKAEQLRPKLVARWSALREDLEQRLLSAGTGVQVNGRQSPRIANTTSVCFKGCDSFAMVQALDTMGVQCSSGSACASGAVSPSPVLLAMGMSREDAFASVRFSFGWGSMESEPAAVSDAVSKVLARTRDLAVADRL